jgi:4-carboxymuconolactone decarboxylase
MKPDEAVVYDLCVELSTKHELSNATFARAKQVMSDRQIVDLVTISGASCADAGWMDVRIAGVLLPGFQASGSA